MLKHKKSLLRSFLLLALLLIAALYILFEPVRSFISRLLMLFTANSSEAMIGYMKSTGGLSPWVSLGLLVFQAVIFPFKYEPLVFANLKVFGPLMGTLLSIVGRILGACLCYKLGELCFSPWLEHTNRSALFQAIRKKRYLPGIIRLLPLNFDFMSYVCGLLRLDFTGYVLQSGLWVVLTTLPYAIKGGYFSYPLERRVIYLRWLLALLISFYVYKTFSKQKADL